MLGFSEKGEIAGDGKDERWVTVVGKGFRGWGRDWLEGFWGLTAGDVRSPAARSRWVWRGGSRHIQDCRCRACLCFDSQTLLSWNC